MKANAATTLLFLSCCCVGACEKKSAPNEQQKSAPTASAAVPLGTRSIGPLSCQSHDFCSEWQKLTAEEMLDARQDCNQSEGKFKSALCPKDHAVASCSHESGSAVVYLYEMVGLDLSVAEAECKKTQGTFSRLQTKSDAGH